ncbi:MAG: Bug family tripartite tricarboxylate transporter substrate binding protein [Lautropia sp.]
MTESRIDRRRSRLQAAAGFLVTASLLAFHATSVALAAYPERPVRIVIPFAPGGETDIFCRAISDRLGAALGQPIVVENKPGATGIIASEAVANSTPDGYTLIFGTAATHALNVSVFRKLPYDPVKSFEPVAFVGVVPLVLYAHPSMPNTLGDFIAKLKAEPSKYSYGAAGSSTSHLGVELFKNAADVKATHVPYKGTGPALVDTVAGHVHFMGASVGVGREMARSGKINAIAVMSRTRLAAAPDVPTFAESGLPLEVGTWNVVMAPKGTPAAVVNRLNAAINETLRDPAIRTKLASLGITPISDSTPSGTRERVEAEIAQWAKAFSLSGASPQ